MKKHNTVKVVLITMLIFMLLTWILPAAYYSSEYVEQGRVQMGLFDLFNYPLTALSYFGYIALFVVVVGGFYGILYKIPAYRSFLDKIVSKVAGKEKIVLSVIMILLAIITSVCGLQLGLIVFFPMLVSIILLMGYDKIVAALTLVGSTMIGIAGTTFGYGNTSIILSVLSLDITSEMLTKVIILVAGLALLILNTVLYIKKLDITKKNVAKLEKKAVKKIEVEEDVEEELKPKKKSTKTTKTAKNTKASGTKNSKSSSKNSKKDIKAAVKDEEVIVVKESIDEDANDGFVPKMVDSKHKIWPLVLGFSIIFVIMILAFIPWSSAFNNQAFQEATTAVTEFKLFGFPLFGKLLGTVNAFGSWSIVDLIVVLAFVVLLLVLIYKVKVDDIYDGFISGAKKAFVPALIVILIYSCLVIVTYHPFQLVIYKAILGLTKGFNVFTSVIVAILASVFNADPSYAFQSVLPYLTSVVTNSDNYAIVGVVYQSIYGLTMLFAPTSLILMVVLSYLNISYKEWFKNIWKLVVELLIVLLLIFIILVLI